MRILVFGCGRTGAALARGMARRGHEVTVVERDPSNLQRLGSDHNCATIVGDGLDEAVLEQAGVESADAFVACTRGDNTNLMAAQLAQIRYKVPKVCVKVNDPQRSHTFTKLGMFCITPNLLTAGMMRDWLLEQDFLPVAEYNRLENGD